MTNNLPDDRVGVMWLRALLAHDEDAASMIRAMTQDQYLMVVGAVLAALRTIEWCPLHYRHAHDLDRLLRAYYEVDDCETS